MLLHHKRDPVAVPCLELHSVYCCAEHARAIWALIIERCTWLLTCSTSSSSPAMPFMGHAPTAVPGPPLAMGGGPEPATRAYRPSRASA